MLDLPVLPLRRETWMRRAACRGLDPAMFVLDVGVPVHLELRAARLVCATCPVSGECLAFALDHDEQGVWAGTTQKQRRAMQSARRAG